jgi:secreted Zn-dependent insulinase-like peptidase
VFLVGNEIQSSSCVLFLLQCGQDVATTSALLEVFVSVVRARLVGRMKSVVPLGYVVGCDLRKMNGTISFRVIVESQYPLPFVHATIEKSIAELGAYLSEADPCVLDMCKQTVLNAKQENSQRMRDSAALLWREISERTYDFGRHEQEMALVQSVNMADLRQFYSQLVHADGTERRCLVISIGPDPILNRLDEVECLTLNDSSRLRDQCDLFPALSQQSLDAWFLKAFNSRTYDYGAPGPPL